ncbi:MAG: hypothetical protein AUI36_20575 [Cyanobacteria bacterium 13_1_40CM_2_61_4]|nr:MAG: hypothetical protein AUI36_20575 [Cyanobacteria bacterium 13_1_40CM_2_61_4]
MFDDFVPNITTAFRIAEFNFYLRSFSGSVVYSWYPDFSSHHKVYSQLYPDLKGRVKPFSVQRIPDMSLAYCVFLNNAYSITPLLAKRRTPFVFTLYPGGGFGLEEDESDKKLECVFATGLVRKLIVTQTITREYIEKKGWHRNCEVEFVYGAVIHDSYFNTDMPPKEQYQVNKDTFDICFVADKYMPFGLNKGYDLFLTSAKVLRRELGDARFHIVGGFDRNDFDVSGLGDSVIFYGRRDTNYLRDFFSRMDMIVSPNIPFKLHPGNFDGFPTASCVEASLCSVAMVCTDILRLNTHYKDGIDICLIEPNVNDIVQKALYFHNNPEHLYRVARNGMEVSRLLFNPEIQMSKRHKVLSKLI